jgi:hypothetical protein
VFTVLNEIKVSVTPNTFDSTVVLKSVQSYHRRNEDSPELPPLGGEKGPDDAPRPVGRNLRAVRTRRFSSERPTRERLATLNRATVELHRGLNGDALDSLVPQF